ncbi:MAG: branched-chain amino acid ABC transporter permease [Actinomycetota bacterium]
MVECLTTELPFRLVGGLSTGGIYALVALGYTLVYGVLQLINFAHSEVFMAGSLAGFLFISAVVPEAGVPNDLTGALVLAAALIPGMLASGAIAVGIERVAYRPLRRRGAPRLAYLISAIGMSFFLSSLVLVWRGREPEGYPSTLTPRRVFEIGNVVVVNKDLIVIVVAILMMVGLERFVRLTRTGRAIRAVAQDAETAALMGVSIDRVITITFLLGGLLAGAAGVLFGYSFGRTRFDIGFLPGIKAFTAAVLGGIGSIQGALAGGFLLGVIENIGAGCFGTQWRDVIAFVILVGVLMFRPTGIFGERT